jgi:hypothetical protein
MQNFYDQLFSEKKKPYYNHLSQVLSVTPKELTILREEVIMGWVMWGQELESTIDSDQPSSK